MSRIGQSPLDLNRFKQVQFGSSIGQQPKGSPEKGLKRLQEIGAGVHAQSPERVSFQGAQAVKRPEALEGTKGISQAALNKFSEGGPNQLSQFTKLAENMNPNKPALPYTATQGWTA